MTRLVFKPLFATLCLVAMGISAQSQQRQEVTHEERELIQEVSSCDDCSSPILGAFSKAYQVKERISDETKGPAGAYSAAYNFAKAWVTASEVVATAGGIVAGVLYPSDLADEDLDTDTTQPIFQPPPSNRGLTVTVTCYDRKGNVIPCGQ